jgi:uncharacterized protein
VRAFLCERVGMLKITIVLFVVFIIAILTSMVGRGGGNFYVPVLVAAGVSMNTAATSAQMILLATATISTLVFHRYKTVDWKLAMIIDPPTDIAAFIGGYFAHYYEGFYLKIIFAILLTIAAVFMTKPVKEGGVYAGQRFGCWTRVFGEYNYRVNLWLAIPVTAIVGFFAGMIGISGGSFKIPFMVLACGVPMRVAVGTSSAMVAVTALMGFVGHTMAGDFSFIWVVPMVCVAMAGGLLGGRISVKIAPEYLTKVFVYTTLVAAGFMAINAFITK